MITKGHEFILTFGHLDMTLGFLSTCSTFPTLVYLLLGLDFKKPMKFDTQTGIIYGGLFSIAVFAVYEFLTGYLLSGQILRGRNPATKCFKFKFLVFFMLKLGAYTAPFFIFNEYEEILIQLIKISQFHWIFYLLKLNPFTIGIFSYQLISFFIVCFYPHTFLIIYFYPAKYFQENRQTIQLRENSIPMLPITSVNSLPRFPRAVEEGKVNRLRSNVYPIVSNFEEVEPQPGPSHQIQTASIKRHSGTSSKNFVNFNYFQTNCEESE